MQYSIEHLVCAGHDGVDRILVQRGSIGGELAVVLQEHRYDDDG
jgi:hypothetical protein